MSIFSSGVRKEQAGIGIRALRCAGLGCAAGEFRSLKPERAALSGFGSRIMGVTQFTLVTIPVYFVLRNSKGLWISLIVLVVTSVFLKWNWLDKLEAEEIRTPAAKLVS